MDDDTRRLIDIALLLSVFGSGVGVAALAYAIWIAERVKQLQIHVKVLEYTIANKEN